MQMQMQTVGSKKRQAQMKYGLDDLLRVAGIGRSLFPAVHRRTWKPDV
jgi:hypothetical protein